MVNFMKDLKVSIDIGSVTTTRAKKSERLQPDEESTCRVKATLSSRFEETRGSDWEKTKPRSNVAAATRIEELIGQPSGRTARQPVIKLSSKYVRKLQLAAKAVNKAPEAVQPTDVISNKLKVRLPPRQKETELSRFREDMHVKKGEQLSLFSRLRVPLWEEHMQAAICDVQFVSPDILFYH